MAYPLVVAVKLSRGSKAPKTAAAGSLDPAIAAAGTGQGLVRDAEAWAWAAKVSTVGLFIIALGATMQALDHVVVPLILAWVIATVLLPVVRFLCRIHIPRPLAVILLVTLLLAGLAAILALLSVPLSYWLTRVRTH